MPTLTFKCPHHSYFTKWFKDPVQSTPCSQCNEISTRVFRISGGVSVVERLDNGVMGRAVERLHNIEEIVNEQADKSSREFRERAGELDS
jgi:AraC-like DNA-binding protein